MSWHKQCPRLGVYGLGGFYVLVGTNVLEGKIQVAKARKGHSPGLTALQWTLQPGLVPPPSVTNTKLTLLVQLNTVGGRVEFVLSPPITRLPAEPQLFSIKVAPLPSVIVRWS